MEKNTYLGHFITFAIPGEPFIVEWLIIGANVQWLPLISLSQSTRHPEYIQSILFRHLFHPNVSVGEVLTQVTNISEKSWFINWMAN